jgi:hypothetical protein
MFKSGKKTSSELKGKIYKAFDDINQTHSDIKYEK